MSDPALGVAAALLFANLQVADDDDDAAAAASVSAAACVNDHDAGMCRLLQQPR